MVLGPDLEFSVRMVLRGQTSPYVPILYEQKLGIRRTSGTTIVILTKRRIHFLDLSEVEIV